MIEHNRTPCINLNIPRFPISYNQKCGKHYQKPFISVSYILKASLNDVAGGVSQIGNTVCSILMDYL